MKYLAYGLLQRRIQGKGGGAGAGAAKEPLRVGHCSEEDCKASIDLAILKARKGDKVGMDGGKYFNREDADDLLKTFTELSTGKGGRDGHHGGKKFLFEVCENRAVSIIGDDDFTKGASANAPGAHIFNSQAKLKSEAGKRMVTLCSMGWDEGILSHVLSNTNGRTVNCVIMDSSHKYSELLAKKSALLKNRMGTATWLERDEEDLQASRKEAERSAFWFITKTWCGGRGNDDLQHEGG